MAAYGDDYEGVVKRTRTSLGAVASVRYAESDDYSSSDDGSVDEDEARPSEVEDNESSEESDVEVEVTKVVRGRGRSSTRGSNSRGRGGRGGVQRKGKAATGSAAGSSDNNSSSSSSKFSKAQQAAKRKAASAKTRKPPHLTDAQWELIEMLCELLKPFAAVQKALEGEKYITSSWLPYHIAKLREHLQSKALSGDDAVSTAATEMLTDFDERWGEWPRSVLLCAALDPRTK
jgi:hypothetical protein